MSASLTLTSSPSCKYITVNFSYSVAVAQNVTLTIRDFQGVNILTTPDPIYLINPSDPPTSFVIPVDTGLAISNGLVTITLKTAAGTKLVTNSVLLHCNIDCCLTKLTNELIECSCDCAKCASSLAKAQKIFLLLNSANYAITQASNTNSSGAEVGFIMDANSKYLKAKEVCDNSCGCDC